MQDIEEKTEDVLLDAWVHIGTIAAAAGVVPLNQHPGLWEFEVGPWKLQVNGRREKIGDVPPYHAFVEFNGWPAGLIHPYGGTIAAGEAANIWTLQTAYSGCRPI